MRITGLEISLICNTAAGFIINGKLPMKSERESDLKTLIENSKQEKATKSSQVTSCTAHSVQINILYSVLGTCISLRGQGGERITHKDAATCVRI